MNLDQLSFTLAGFVSAAGIGASTFFTTEGYSGLISEGCPFPGIPVVSKYPFFGFF